MLREHAQKIYTQAIEKNMPNEAVKRAIENNYSKIVNGGGELVIISIGKAGWEMANDAHSMLGDRIDKGVVITKYNHSHGAIGNLEIYEAGHPVVDFNGICATKRALELTEGLSEKDTVLFLVSGGGSALFESVDCPLEKMQELTGTLLKCGASINEINTVRKHISNVKGGKLARHVYPAEVFAIVLSDVVGNDLSTIASGPAVADSTTVQDCLDIIDRYKISLDGEMMSLLKNETPKEIKNATHILSGSVSMLCQSAKETAQSLGYCARVVSDCIDCDVEKMGEAFEELILKNQSPKSPLAFIFGGEVTVRVRGEGKGGRNQHLALLCAEKIKNRKNMAVFCVGSDGTDGPTDMAGGFVDGDTYENMAKKGISAEECLKNNDSYNGLASVNGLIYTGPTGTNVNDLYVLLIQKGE